MTLHRLVILHGYSAHPGKHWFSWLRDQLAPHGIATEIPELPDTRHPQAGPWTDAAVAAIGVPDAHTAVVGHSLGTITAIRALGRIFADHPAAQLGALALVSPFIERPPIYPELDPFVTGAPDLALLAPRIGRSLVVRSDDDPEVPPALADPVADGLGAELVEIPGAGHFLEDGGFTELPVVRDWLIR